MPAKRSTKINEPVVPKQIDDLKKLYSDRLSTYISRANTTLITWVSALLLIAITTVLPLSMELQKKSEQRKAVANNQQQLEEEEDELNRIRSETNANRASLSTAGTRNESNTRPAPPGAAGNSKITANSNKSIGATDFENKVAEQNRDVTREKGEVASSSQQLTQIQNEMAEIPLPFGKLPIRKIYSPVLWAALFAAFIAFFLFIRVRIFSTLARLVDIHRVSGKRPDEFEGLGTGIPFWLAPLPKFVKKEASDATVSRGDFEHFLGWKRDSVRNSVLTITCLVSGFVLAGSVVFTLYRGIAAAWTESPYIGLAILVATTSLCVIGLFSTLYWLIPRIELQGFSTRVIGRRHFIAGAGAVLAVSTAALFVPKKYLYRSLLPRNPRYRRRARYLFNEDFRGKFCRPAHLNSTVPERLVYYVGANRFSSHLYRFHKGGKSNDRLLSGFDGVFVIPREQIIKKIQAFPAADPGPSPKALPDGLPAFRMNPRQFSAVVECLSLEQVKAGKIDVAIELLLAAIVVDAQPRHPGGRRFSKQPDYRLYDLLAGLTYKYSFDGHKQTMLKHIEENWLGQDCSGNKVCLAKRVEKWKNPPASWTSKWAKEQPFTWKHPFVNWKDASKPLDSAYAEYLV